MTRTAESLPPASEALPALDRILFSSRLVEIGKFRVRAEDPRFHDSGAIQRHILVFPRTPVWIRHEGKRPFMAGPDLVTYYNRGQVYRRDSVRGLPDRCEWFAFPAGVLQSALAGRDPSAAGRSDRPFSFSKGPGDPRAYLEQRRLVEALSGGDPPDALEVEERALGILARLVPLACDFAGVREARPARNARGDRELVENAKAELSRSLGAPARLADVAARLEVSPFRLCRTFRRGTGSTVHRYRNRLRLAASLELLRQPRRGLTEIALALGFSSHSHFTAAFRKEYGAAPREIRRACGSRSRR
ncbi:MAG TPA: AraC family transcriptional regulator [Thermoanaerobaculia bacterium]|nr:AraC family transcriptional regulator [Thermoanaerobaculia bacterium]